MKRNVTFTYEYNYFEPGTKITPASPRSVLEMGVTYTVVSCIAPRYAGDRAIVFVVGHQYGVSTEYLKEVE
jgi:hypothetical protein